MQRFDSDRDGCLTYTDISEVFRPKNPALAKEFGQRMPMELQSSQMIGVKASQLIRKLFMSYVKIENHIENMKKELLKRPKFNIERAFSVLNMDGSDGGFDKISIDEL